MGVPTEIYKIVEAGCQAPSGGNSQPWHFEFSDNTLTVVAEPEKDHKILNFRNRGTLFAHGALLENIAVASKHFGYEADIRTLPDPKRPNITAIIHFKKTQPQQTELYDAIFKRTTNRKIYGTEPLPQAQERLLLESSQGFSAQLILINDREKIRNLCEASSVAEIVNLENKTLHSLFFKEITWTEKEEHEKKSGLYLKTMELQPPQHAALKLLKNWNVMKLFNRVGFVRNVIAKGNAKNYAKTAAIGAILVKDKDEDFLTAGRMLQRLWLTATSSGLSLHLMTGVPFLYQGVLAGNTAIYSQKEINLIKSGYNKITSQIDIGDHFVAALFRLGKGKAPSAKSSKKDPNFISSIS